jgi:hypothetical protein
MSPTTKTVAGTMFVAIVIVHGCGALVTEYRQPPPSHELPRAGSECAEFGRGPMHFASRVVIGVWLRAVDWGRTGYERYYYSAFSTVEGTAWDAWYPISGLRSPIPPETAQDVPQHDAVTLVDAGW